VKRVNTGGPVYGSTETRESILNNKTGMLSGGIWKGQLYLKKREGAKGVQVITRRAKIQVWTDGGFKKQPQYHTG